MAAVKVGTGQEADRTRNIMSGGPEGYILYIHTGSTYRVAYQRAPVSRASQRNGPKTYSATSVCCAGGLPL